MWLVHGSWSVIYIGDVIGSWRICIYLWCFVDQLFLRCWGFKPKNCSSCMKVAAGAGSCKARQSITNNDPNDIPKCTWNLKSCGRRSFSRPQLEATELKLLGYRGVESRVLSVNLCYPMSCVHRRSMFHESGVICTHLFKTIIALIPIDFPTHHFVKIKRSDFQQHFPSK